ncbi:odorant receptor 42b-like [Lucilia sericata]|uniref:odorant receptor 42b-like n=1 Tax=Lucilia sericata TaxID=13632 RepID=UPI0018A82B11|nr:odorant receptor 42b-like [Lucilia sericata]
MEDLENQPPNAITLVKQVNPSENQKEQPSEVKQEVEKLKKGTGFDNIETTMSLRYLFNGFRFLGVYMPKKNKTLYIIWSLLINTLVTIYLPLAFALSFMTMSGEELEIGNLLTSVQVFINVLGCSTKIILMAFLLPKLLSCEPVIRKLDKRCHTQEERESIKRIIKQGNRFVVLFSISYWSYSSSTGISAAIFHRLPYNIYNPLIDSKVSNLHYYAAVFVELAIIDVACFQQVVDDSYAVIYVSILRTHLDILLKRIKNMNENAKVSLQENFEELKMCIIDHKNIIQLYNIVAPVISITIFVQFTITATILGTTLINILLFATNFASIVASCFYVLAVVVEIFPLCYYAQCLMDESNRLSDVIFHSNWVDQDIRYRKMLIFFIHRSQKTIEFTAGKLFPITLNSFLSIAKFSFSLYTFIKEMGIKEKFSSK